MLNYEVVAEGLVRYTNWFCRFDNFDLGMTFTMEACFEEAYEIMAALRIDKVLGIGRFNDIAHTFCDKVLQHQGLVETDMYYMGYGNTKNAEGVPACSCIADGCSVASAVAETVMAYPDHPKNEKYIASMKRFADYVLNTYITEDGVIGVGILGHRINPMKVYWCANSLFGKFLIKLGEITNDPKYLDAAVPAMDFIATMDYENTRWKEFDSNPTQVILYTGEGLLEALLSPAMVARLGEPAKFLGRDEMRAENKKKDAEELAQADNRVANKQEIVVEGASETLYDVLKKRWDEFSEWLIRNQELSGVFVQKSGRSFSGYDPGLSWLMYRSVHDLEPNKKLEDAVKRQLSYLIRDRAKPEMGVFCCPFPTALAHLTFANIAGYLQEEDSEGFQMAVDDATEYTKEMYW